MAEDQGQRRNRPRFARTNRITVHLSDREYQRMTEVADLRELPISDYLRRLLEVSHCQFERERASKARRRGEGGDEQEA